ncbi:tetratricopeptide repeat protein [Thermodesulfobacteriota bacterium]
MERFFKPVGRWESMLPMVLIVVVVFLAFLPILNNGVVWDDGMNILDNPDFRGLSASHLSWMFTTFHDANYHPVCWMSFGLDYVVWGLNPAGYHLTNLMLHVLNAVLFYCLVVIVLRQTNPHVTIISKPGIQISAFTGTLFWAIHPLRVENVAWISARGDVLCCVFYLLAIIAYLKMVQQHDKVDRRKWFLLSLVFFVLSLLSRAWGMTFPVVLLILDVYPLRRIVWKGRFTSPIKLLLIEKIPFAMFSLSAGLAAFFAKKAFMMPLTHHSFLGRIVQASYGLYFYVFKTIVPLRLSPLYLLNKSFNPMEIKYILCVPLVLGITAGLIVMRHRWPWAITAWFCYAVIVSPLLGIVQTGPQLVADRYTYISCLPFGVLVAAGIFGVRSSMEKGTLSYRGWSIAIIGSLTCLALMSVLSSYQTRVWKDMGSFWSQIIRLDPTNPIAYSDRSGFYKERGDIERAMEDLNTSIRLDPTFIKAFYNRALLRHELNDVAGAISDYSQVIKLDPKYIEAYNNRGSLFQKQGNLTSALADYEMTIRIAPSSPEAYVNRGIIRQEQNDLKSAIEDFRKALNVAPAGWTHRGLVEKMLKKAIITEKA